MTIQHSAIGKKMTAIPGRLSQQILRLLKSWYLSRQRVLVRSLLEYYVMLCNAHFKNYLVKSFKKGL